MRASLHDIQLLEAYLQNRLSPAEQENFQQRLLLDPLLYEQLHHQKKVYRLVRQRGRRQLRSELEKVHAELFGSRGNRKWQQRVLQWFGK